MDNISTSQNPGIPTSTDIHELWAIREILTKMAVKYVNSPEILERINKKVLEIDQKVLDNI